MKEQCFFVEGTRHLSDASSCNFFCSFAVALLLLCIHSSLVVTTILVVKRMTMSPADTEEGSPGHSALSTLMLLHACTHLKLWIFLIWQRAYPSDRDRKPTAFFWDEEA